MNLPTKEELEDAAEALRYVENTGRTEALLRALADGAVLCRAQVRMADNGMLVARFEPLP